MHFYRVIAFVNLLRISTISFCFIFSGLGIRAQNSDCDDAVSVCNQVYTESNSPAGTGQIFEMAPGTCQTGGEFNSAWYVFSPQNDGVLNFVLQPNSMMDDYDWSLFDITNNGCEGINDGTSPEVSCNSYGETGGVQGETGISSANGGFGNNNGPGNLNGPPFNADLNVTAGSVYALVIMNFSATLDGYNLDFTGNTADIYDITPPALVDVVVDCDNQTIHLTFDESVHLAAVNNNSFPIIAPDGSTITPTSLNTGGAEWGSDITLNFNTALGAGDYSTSFSTSNPVEDICGNAWEENVSITINPLAEYTLTSDDACNGSDGSINLEITNAADGNFSVEYEGNLTNAVQWTGLAPGTYDFSVINDQGCAVDQSIAVGNVTLSVNAGTDAQLCDMQTDLNAVHSGGSFSWLADPTLTFSSMTDPSAHVVCDTPAARTIQCVVTLDDCEVTDDVTISFAYPPATTIHQTEITCYDDCNGTLEVISDNGAAITATLGNTSQTGTTILFENICAGEYEVALIHSPGCESTYNAQFYNPPQVIAGFNATAWQVPITDPHTVLTSASENALTLDWIVILNTDSIIATGEQLDLTLPQVVGFYPVRLTASDANGCSNTVTADIEVRDAFRFYVPNSFTPNGDDVNDIFYVQCNNPPTTFQLRIFNRFGDLIFQSTDYEEVWTGDVKGGDYFAGDGVYTWQLNISGTDVEPKTYSGHLTMVR